MISFNISFIQVIQVIQVIHIIHIIHVIQFKSSQILLWIRLYISELSIRSQKYNQSNSSCSIILFHWFIERGKSLSWLFSKYFNIYGMIQWKSIDFVNGRRWFKFILLHFFDLSFSTILIWQSEFWDSNCFFNFLIWSKSETKIL
jgi:hypothetical protein